MLEVGQKIYNHGDMANESHFGTVTQVRTDKWGTNYQITHENGVDTYWIPAVLVSPKFEGHSGTRIVTMEAYVSYRLQKRAEFEAWAKRTAETSLSARC